MRMNRRGLLGAITAFLGMSAVFADGMDRATNSLNALSQVMRLNQPNKYKSKPNRLSQKKRRLNARRLGKFK
ncbi:hypothetical protein [Acinetobacter kyonggiensis]|uniref:Uncharacterized protein n=1 Tax=Acinetobacter kyonggiensis TaxID=595670 RepID=A0A1H3L7A2_9GAMM|nr:hypothetical protein [Acinetobacter kyonggiensis]SDY60293.1 hypothetical protein SAMN05421643_11642 [Acinetobacter kyonggiensis]